jgi:hypothetical protein
VQHPAHPEDKKIMFCTGVIGALLVRLKPVPVRRETL